MYQRSSWTFNETVAKQFEEHVRKSLSFYERLQEMVVQLSDYFVKEEAVIYDLGCATGETICRLHQRHACKSLQFIGLDSSASMIEKATQNCPYPSVHFEVGSLENYQFPVKSPLILSILTLHFLPVHKRKQVLQKIFDALYEGGCFVLVDKTYSKFSAMQDMWGNLHYEDKIKHGFTHKEVLEKEQSLRGVLTPLSVKEHLLLLKDIGFQTDLFFKEWSFTGFLAIKPLQMSIKN